MILTDRDVERRRAVVALGAADIKRILGIRDLVERSVDRYVATFISALEALPEAASLFTSPSILSEVKTRKREHLLALAGGEYGVAYAEQRIALGVLYSRVQLEPRVFLGAFHGLMKAIGTDIIAAGRADPDAAYETFASLKKVSFFDIGIIVDVLIAEREQTIAAQQEVIRELSTPALQLRDHLLILPLIGVVDSDRARQLTDNLLRTIRTNRAKAVVIDITGVPMVDSKVAQHLVQTVTACQLMGVAAIVTGISGAVAQALVTLGVEFEAFNAVGDLQRGIEAAERLLGYQVVRTASPAH
ncbi:MAG TPA: protoglobin domain-containing protein [Stellaceae bacterium]|nr:protoglobin domain-containing protein [Stellaceae bacterium]